MKNEDNSGYSGHLKKISNLNYVLTVITFILSVFLMIILVKWKYSTRSDVNIQYAWYTVFIGIPLLLASLLGVIFGGLNLWKNPNRNVISTSTFLLNTIVLLIIIFYIVKSFFHI